MPEANDNAVTRVVLIDRLEIARAGVARILDGDDGFAVVGEHGGPGARLTEDVDVVLMRVDRESATSAIAAIGGSRVLALAAEPDDVLLWDVVAAGAAGFILEDAPVGELLRALAAVGCGGVWLDPRVTETVLDSIRAVVTPVIRRRRRLDVLTNREHAVLRLMARGATNAEMAAKLSVSAATVKTYVGSVFGKLGARDRAAAIVYAYDHGVVAARSGTTAVGSQI